MMDMFRTVDDDDDDDELVNETRRRQTVAVTTDQLVRGGTHVLPSNCPENPRSTNANFWDIA